MKSFYFFVFLGTSLLHGVKRENLAFSIPIQRLASKLFKSAAHSVLPVWPSCIGRKIRMKNLSHGTSDTGFSLWKLENWQNLSLPSAGLKFELMSHLNGSSNCVIPAPSLDCFSWLRSKRVEAEWTILCPKPLSDLAHQIVLSEFHFSDNKYLFLLFPPRTQTISRRLSVIHRTFLPPFSGNCHLSSYPRQPQRVFLALWISTHVSVFS